MVEIVPSATPILQSQAAHTALGPEAIERLAESLPLPNIFFLWSLGESCPERCGSIICPQILTESEFNNFENAVNNSDFQQASNDDLREGVLGVLVEDC